MREVASAFAKKWLEAWNAHDPRPRRSRPGVNPRFEHIATLEGADSFGIHYRGLRGKSCAEYFELSANGKVRRSCAHEAEQSAS